MKKISITLNLSSGPAVIEAHDAGVPGLVAHEEAFRWHNWEEVRFNPKVRCVTHVRSSGIVGTRRIYFKQSWADTRKRVIEAYGHLDWTLSAEEIVRDRRYHDAVHGFEVGVPETPDFLVDLNIKNFDEHICKGLIRT